MPKSRAISLPPAITRNEPARIAYFTPSFSPGIAGASGVKELSLFTVNSTEAATSAVLNVNHSEA